LFENAWLGLSADQRNTKKEQELSPTSQALFNFNKTLAMKGLEDGKSSYSLVKSVPTTHVLYCCVSYNSCVLRIVETTMQFI